MYIGKPPPRPPAPKVVEASGDAQKSEVKDGNPNLEGDKGLISSWPPRSSAFGATVAKGMFKVRGVGVFIRI